MQSPKKQTQSRSQILVAAIILLALLAAVAGAHARWEGSGENSHRLSNSARLLRKNEQMAVNRSHAQPSFSEVQGQDQAACEGPLFSQPINFPTIASPRMVTTSDFNLDGHLDFAVVGFSARTIAVFLGDGRGGFAPAPESPVRIERGWSIISGDFNGDGQPDLAVPSLLPFPNGEVNVLLGQGDGRFVLAPGSPLTAPPLRTGAAYLAQGDFNRDGKQDLAVGLADSAALAILLGNGDGSFTEGVPVSVPFTTGTTFVAADDFNRDGRPDLVIESGSDNPDFIWLLLGNGLGGFGPRLPFRVGADIGTGPTWAVVADFNSDGHADVATANFNRTISVLLGNGVDGFGPPLVLPTSGNGTSLAAADFNQDGKLDLALSYRELGMAGGYAVFLGNGDGTFGAQQTLLTSDSSLFVGAADFNHDGRPDLITTNLNANTVSVHLNSCQPVPADLSLRKTASAKFVRTGANVTWTINVANQGPGEARSVVVRDLLDSRTTFVNCTATNGGVCGGTANHRTVTFAALPAGAEATIRLTARLNCSLANGATLANTATLAATTSDPVTQNNADSAMIRALNPAPNISRVSVDKPVLWPPNHKFVDVTVNYNVTDNCDSAAALRCHLSVKSNEPSPPSNPDWVIVDAHHVKLRAARDGKGEGRVYTITITCQDSAGRTSCQTVTVRVPQSQGK